MTEPQTASLNLPCVSVVLTTRNEAANIVSCLESVHNQSYPSDKIEIIVVDNGSNDETKTLAQKFTEKVFDKGPERSAQRNFGIRAGTGKYALYLDADMTLTQHVIRDCVEALEADQGVVAAHISEIIMGTRFFSRVRRFERGFYDATVIDCVRFFRRDAFETTGGFDESMSGPEDWDLDKKFRQTGNTVLVKTPIHHHEEEFQLSAYLKKKAYYASSFDRYISKWGKDDPDVVRQFSVWYRFFGVFIENGKWKSLLRHPVMAIGMYFLRFMVGLTFLRRNND